MVITFDDEAMKETEKSWLACAIDTDGFVGMKIQKVKIKKYEYNYVLGLIGFSNTHQAIVEEFGRLIRAKINTNRQNKLYEDKFKTSTVTAGSKKIVEILTEIMPYLITKKDRAQYVLDFCKYKIMNQVTIAANLQDLRRIWFGTINIEKNTQTIDQIGRECQLFLNNK